MKAHTKDSRLTTRRRFFFTAGAALTAPVAAVAAAPGTTDDHEALQARLALLEDLDAIRALHRAVLKRLNAGEQDELATLFDGRGAGLADARIRRLSDDAVFGEDVIEIAADGQRASARLHVRAELEVPIASDDTAVAMARLQGGGVVRHAEQGVLECVCVKRRGAWKIERAEFQTLRSA
jgi:hypothetical protein